MNKGILKWMRTHANKIGSSIAFYPAVIVIGFLVLSWAMLKLDFSDFGRNLKTASGWLTLKDASTARAIISTIATGIISLTVFSFSMVMIVLNQAASQMSNRVLKSMIENRFQQIVLGCYIGPIVYALFLLSTIRDINSGVYVPALSIYLLILLTVIDIFLFIYFLDYVTQSVKYETIIHRIHEQTMKQMQASYTPATGLNTEPEGKKISEVATGESGYFQGFDKAQLMRVAEQEDCLISIQHVAGAYLIRGACLLKVHAVEYIAEETKKKILLAVDLYRGQPIGKNPDYGFHQLAEVGIRALSPGINDPATAVLTLNSLHDLFSYRLFHAPPAFIKDKHGNIRISLKATSFEELFGHCIIPIWEYGKNDRYIQDAMISLMEQLKSKDTGSRHTAFFNKLVREVNRAIADRTL